MAVVDSLEVQIQSKADAANDSLNELIKKMGIVAEGISAIGNNKGLDDFAKRAQEAVKGFSSIQNAAKGLSSSIAPEVQKASKSLGEITAKYKDLGKGFKFTGSTAAIQKQIESYSNALEKAKLKKEELETSGKTGGQTYEAAVRDTVRYENVVASLKGQLQEMQSTAQSLDGINIHLMSDDNRQTLEELQSSLEGFRSALQSGSEYQPFAEIQHGLEELRERFPEAEQWAKAFEDSVSRIGGMRPFENTWDGVGIPPELQGEAEAAEDSIQSAKEKMEEFQKGLNQLVVPEIREENINKLYSALAKSEEKLEQLRIKLENGVSMGRMVESIDDTGFRNLQEQIALTERQAEALRAKIAEVGRQSGAAAETDRFRDALLNLSAIGGKTKTALSGLASFVKKTGSAFSGAASKIASLVKSMFSLKKAGSETHTVFSMGFGKLLKYGLGFESILAVVNKLRGAFRDSMGNLVQYSSEANKSMSMMKNSLDALKNSLSVAFSPIINVVAPIISSFIDMMTRAFNLIGQFFAALTGKNFAVQAVKGFSDYSKGISGAGSAAEKAAKKVKGALRPFDELKIITLSQSGSGAGTGSLLPGDMFETVPIEGGILGLFSKLKELIESKDWEGLGAFIAEGINRGLQKVYDVINWNSVGPKVTAFMDAFTRTFNSLVDNVDWNLLGATVGTGINTIVNTLNLLVEGIDWVNLGAKFSVGMRGLINEVDWRNLGNLLGSKFMIQWDIFRGFVDDMWRTNDFTGLTGWEELGISLGNAVNGLFEKINFGDIAHVLASGFNGAIQTLKNFIATVEWDDVADNITTGLNTMIHETNWEEAGTVLGNAALELLGVFEQVANDTDWEGLGRGIGQFLENIPWGEILQTTFSIIWDVLSGLISGLFDTNGGKVVLGIGAGVLAVAAFFNPAGALIAAIAGAAALIIANWDEIMDGVDRLKEWVEEKWTGIKEKITGTTTELRGRVPQEFSGMHGDMAETLRSFRENTDTEWGAIDQNVEEKLGKMSENSRTALENIGKHVSGTWSTMETNTQSTMDKTGRKINDTWTGAQNSTSRTLTSMKTTVASNTSAMSSTMSGKLSSMRGSINNFSTNAKTIWSEANESLKRKNATSWNEISRVSGNNLRGVKNTISSEMSQAKSGWESAWDSIFGKTSNILGSIKGAVSSAMDAISGMISAISGALDSLFAKAASASKVTVPSKGGSGGSGGKNKRDAAPRMVSPEINTAAFQNVNIPALATGGITMKHTFAEIGEYNRPEAILPLTNDRAMGMIAESIYENYNGNADYPKNGYFDNGRMSELISETRRQNRLMEQQNQLLERILGKPTMEIGDVNNALVKYSMERGGNYRGGNMSRLAVAEEVYR